MNPELLSRILVPLDGSPQAEAILPPLRRLLSPDDSSLTLMEVLPSLHPSARENAERYLWQVAFELRRGGARADFSVRFGPAAEKLLEEAEARKSTLIALATHGHSGLQRLILGSVAERVLQRSPVPVLLTRSFPSSRPRERKDAPVRKLLLPLDGSPEALHALDPALSLARRLDATVHLLQVGEASPYEGHWESPDETAKRAEEALREACIPTTFERLYGNPAEEILKSAEEHDTDLIVMSTHGRSGPLLWLKGSVTADILQRTNVPMLVVRRHATLASDETVTAGAAQNPGAPEDISLPVMPPA